MNTEAIQKLIQEKNIQQSELAKAVGVSEAFISGLIKGYKMPSVGLLKQIADYFGVTVDSLLH